MPHFKVTVSPPSITITGAALGPDVHPTLRQARAVLIDQVHAARDAADAALTEQITKLRDDARSADKALHAAMKVALKVREADLASDGPAAQPTLPTIGDQMREIGRQVEAGATGGEKAA